MSSRASRPPQALDDRPLGRERLRPERQHGRHDGGQARRDRGDRQAHPDQEDIAELLPVERGRRRRRTPARAAALTLVTTASCSLARDGVFSCCTAAQHPRDLTDLSLHPVAVTTISPRPRVTAVFRKAMSTRSPSAHVRRPSTDAVLLQRRECFRRSAPPPRSRGSPREEPAVRWDVVARLDLDEVARHEVLGGHVGGARRRDGPSPWITWIFASASTLAPAFNSWLTPRTTLRRVSQRMTMTVENPAARPS